MIHVLPIGIVEEAQLLLTLGGISGGINVEQDLAAPPDLFATKMDEDLQQCFRSAVPDRVRKAQFSTVRLGRWPAKPYENRSQPSHNPRWLGAARLILQWRSRGRSTV